MNPTATSFFNNHLDNLKSDYANICEEIESHKQKNGITSHLNGDKEYYALCIEKWETYLDIKRTEAILNGTEFSYIRQHKPVAMNHIRKLNDLIRHKEEYQ